jgi:hypothetical protein
MRIYLPTREDLINRKFGKLTVIAFSHLVNRKAVWLCQCLCGHQTTRRADSLKRAKYHSCGINGCGWLTDYDRSLHRTFDAYKQNAKKRNLPLLLTKEQMTYLISLPCHYCDGLPPNGIDRKLNTLGYTLENSVPCCSDCNYLKNKRSYIEFLLKVKQIYQKLIGR